MMTSNSKLQQSVILIKSVSFFILLYLLPFHLWAQEKTSGKVKRTDPVMTAGTNVVATLGDFSNTHFGGASVEFTFKPGVLASKTNKIRLHTQTGATYFSGKKETVSGYEYTYPGYMIFHLAAGPSIIIAKQFESVISIGPAIGIYNGTSSVNAIAQIKTVYTIRKLQVGPCLLAIKDFGTNTLWSAGIGANYKIN